jgi:hypothetical protein
MDGFSATYVRELLTRLHHVRPAVFGSDHHKFALNEPLPESAVSMFERDLSIQLPNEYRSFITGVGDGGAGPFYGVFPLGMVDDNFGLRQWHVNDGLVDDPSGPFDLVSEWNDTSTSRPMIWPMRTKPSTTAGWRTLKMRTFVRIT